MSEKKEVISFLMKEKIPLYTKVYKQALKRHIINHDLIDINNQFTKK